jgi:hypothetical protein
MNELYPSKNMSLPPPASDLSLRKLAEEPQFPLPFTKAASISSSNTKERGQDGFEFINITGSFLLDSNSRASVRVHAMRDYHRRRKQNLDGNYSLPFTTTKVEAISSAKGLTQKFRLCEHRNRRPRMSIKPQVRKVFPLVAQEAGESVEIVKNLSKSEPHRNFRSLVAETFPSEKCQTPHPNAMSKLHNM